MMAGISALVAFVAIALIASPAIAASISGNTLKMTHTTYNSKTDLSAISWMTNEKLATEGAHGFGILTDKEHEAVIVTTTHGGIKDSSAQTDASDPRWHTHYVVLGEGDNPHCGDEHYVKDIMFEHVGTLVTKNKGVKIASIPQGFTGHSALTGNPLTIEPGKDFMASVSFNLEPKFEGGSLVAVCVVDVQMHDSQVGHGRFD